MRNAFSIAAVIFLLQFPLAATAQNDVVDCVHRDISGGFTPAENCALFTDSRFVRVTRSLLENVHFDQDGLSCVLFGGHGYFLIREDGRAVNVPTWDNLCATFAEGVTVGIVDGREAYIDKQLEVVLEPGFEVLGSFDGGYAKVCNGPFVVEDRGERRTMGGMCGLINRSGELVIEPLYPVETFSVFRDYRNAHNNCPAPPVDDAESALCHARRLVVKEFRHGDDWTDYSVARRGERWEVSFHEVGRAAEFTIVVGAEKADRLDLIRGDVGPTLD